MSSAIAVRAVERTDYERWLPLWHGYNAFYGRKGATALPESVIKATWERFFDPQEPMQALVAVQNNAIKGIAHFLFHRNTIALADACYLQDLYTEEAARGLGIGRALIEAVAAAARATGASRFYWQTRAENMPARRLYDQLASTGFIVYRMEL